MSEELQGSPKGRRRHEQWEKCFLALLANGELYRDSESEVDFVNKCEDMASHAATTLEEDYELRIDDPDLDLGDDNEPSAPVLQEGAR
jgi:hypothetical protein